MKIFIDTSVFIAHFVASEQHHRLVEERFQKYKSQRALFVTSDYVLSELFTRIVYDFGRNSLEQAIRGIRKAISKGEIRLLSVDAATFTRSTEVMVKFSDHQISLTDASIVVLYKNLALDEVFTLDSDFKKLNLTVSFPNLTT